MGNQALYTSPGSQSNYAGLPFGELLKLLQENGFIVDANDHTEFSAVFDSMQPATHEELKYYLAPIICRNEDEQKKFYKIFDLFIQEHADEEPVDWWDRVKSFLKKLPWWVWIILIIAAGIVTWILTRPVVRHGKLNPAICIGVSTVYANEPVQFSSHCNDTKGEDTVQALGEWDFGDNTPIVKGNSVIHVFKKHGSYHIHFAIGNSDGGKAQFAKDTVIAVCPALVKAGMSNTGTIFPGDSVMLKVDDIDPDFELANCFWVIENPYDSKNDTLAYNQTKSSLYYEAEFAGNDYIATFYYPGGCIGGVFNFNVEEVKPYTLKTVAQGGAFKNSIRINPLYSVLLLLLGLAGIITAIYLFRKKILTPPEKKEADTSQFTGMEGPFEIPYLQKDRHIQSLLDISKISYNLSRRTEAEMPYLSIPATITNSIHNYGIVTPAYKNRQKPREYLVLIDATNTHNQQLNLFTYLVKKFINENVLIDLYFYYRTFGNFYKDNHQAPVNFQKLRDCNYQSSLVIIGKGYELLAPNAVFIDPVYRSEFEWWEKRVLVTPVPARDWSVSEKILSEFFYLVPADITGWISLAQFITEDAGINHFTEKSWDTYNARFVDGGDIAALKAYLADDDLFQWLCAAAIHHNIRWEILIELGHALLNKNNVPYKLNYTNLLKLARISWMEEGVFPATTRLELLKNLSEENELLARKTMLQLLKESDDLIDPSAFSYEEKQVQKYTDSFVLFANNASTHAAYQEDAAKFLSLWEAGKIMDTPVKTYLEKEGDWSTALRSSRDSTINISISEYIQERDDALNVNKSQRQRLIKRIGRACMGFAVLCMLLLAGLNIYRNNIAGWKINRFFQFVRVTPPAKADLSFIFKQEGCIRQYLSTSDTLIVSFDPQLGKGRSQWIATTYFSGPARLVDSLPPYSLTFHDVDIHSIIGKDVRISLRGDKSDQEYFVDFNLADTSYELLFTGDNCVSTSTDPVYISFDDPITKEDSARLEKGLRTTLPALKVLFQETVERNVKIFRPTGNYVHFGDLVDSSDKYAIISRLLSLGVQIRKIGDIDMGNDPAAAQDQRLRRTAQVKNEVSFNNLPIFTDDSLRCLLLGQCDENKPSVQIEYDPFGYRDSMELFRKSLVTVGWQAPVSQLKNYNYPSVVRYYTATQKNYADTIALMASRYFGQTIKSQFVQPAANANLPGGIELWIKSICIDIKYNNIFPSLAVPYVYKRNPNIYFRFTATKVYRMEGDGTAGSSQEEEFEINPNMKKCGRTYTLYGMPAQFQFNVNTFVDEKYKSLFYFDNRSLTILDDKGKVDRQLSLIFDFSNYQNQRKAYDGDIGAWRDQGKPSEAIRFTSGEYSNSQESKQSYHIVNVFVDKRSGCRIYWLEDNRGILSLVTVFDGSDGKYIGQRFEIGANAAPQKMEFQLSWSGGRSFTKIMRGVPSVFLDSANMSIIPDTIFKKSVLWVDDNIKDDQSTINTMRGYLLDVTTVSDNKKALAALQSGQKFDLIISDLSQPNDSASGLTLLNELTQLRNRGTLRKIVPVIIYTSPESQVKYGDQATKNGALEVITLQSDLLDSVRKFFSIK